MKFILTARKRTLVRFKKTRKGPGKGRVRVIRLTFRIRIKETVSAPIQKFFDGWVDAVFGEDQEHSVVDKVEDSESK